jgi:hypothetical protein
MLPLEELAHIALVPIDIEVQLDQRWMKLSEILSLEEGSIIEMRRSAGENLDIYIGSRLAAFGEREPRHLHRLAPRRLRRDRNHRKHHGRAHHRLQYRGLRMAAVIVVLTLLGGCMFLLKKRGVAKAGTNRMEVIEKLSLNPQTTLHLVRIEDQTLLLATSNVGQVVNLRRIGNPPGA